MASPYLGPTEAQRAVHLRNEGCHEALSLILAGDRAAAQQVLLESVSMQFRFLTGVRLYLVTDPELDSSNASEPLASTPAPMRG